MDQINFSFSDSIAGYIAGYDKDADSFRIKTSDNREFTVTFASNTYAWIANNLNEPRQWCADQMRGMLTPGRFLFVYGTYYYENGGFNFTAQYLVFLAPKTGEYGFEKAELVDSADSGPRRFLPARAIRRQGSQLRQLPHDHQGYRREGSRQLPPGDRHHLAPRIRFCVRLYVDRRRSVPRGSRKGYRIFARASALRRPR